MQKRSLTIAGHRTSISIEPEFWTGLEEMAAAAGQSLPQVVAQIDETRSNPNLSSSLRVAVLDYYRNAATEEQSS